MTFDNWPWPQKRKHMIAAAITALEAQGFELKKVPGRGLSSIWTFQNGDESGRLAIRTSQDRWFAFPRHQEGWKTLDHVNKVVVATVNIQDAPDAIEVYLFDAAEVLRRFNESYRARIEAGMRVKNGFGMWIKINKIDHENYPQGVGSGIGDHCPPIYTEPFCGIESDDMRFLEDIVPLSYPEGETSIVDILDAAKLRISEKLGVPASQVMLEMRLGM